MARAGIANPILNSPFTEPRRHFRFDEHGITDEVVDARRASSYFVLIARPRLRGKAAQAQLALEIEQVPARVEENRLTNEVRAAVFRWRQGGHQGVTRTTGRLLAHWTNPERERPLFVCQVEAAETVIYLAEAARRFGDGRIGQRLAVANEATTPLLP